MSMVFCRGCGKEIHETAPTCPNCGFVQIEINGSEKKSPWMAGLSFVLAILCFLNWFSIDNWKFSHDQVVGIWMFSIAAITLASISLNQKRKGKIFSYISLALGILTILMLLGYK